MLRSSVPVAGRGREKPVAEMVPRFSVLALASSALLGVTGLITAWTHLHQLEALWKTPYGNALMRKLVVVAALVLLLTAILVSTPSPKPLAQIPKPLPQK